MRIEIEILSKKIVDKLKEKKLIISTIESCTGGGLASIITDIPGASNVIKEAFVTYSNESKVDNVGVSKALIDKCGVVSSEVAMDMALKLKKKTGCDITVSTTGNLGPDVLENKEAGLVYIGIAFFDDIKVYQCKVQGDRLQVKEEVIHSALKIIDNLI